MASSEWPDNVERGPTSNEFVKRALSTVSPNETARRKLRWVTIIEIDGL